MAINYPAAVDTHKKRIVFLYIAQQQLKLLNNAVAKWLNEGITEAEYDSGIDYSETMPGDVERDYVVELTPMIKNQILTYISQLSMEQFRQFQEQYEQPRRLSISAEIAKYKNHIRRLTDYIPNLDNII